MRQRPEYEIYYQVWVDGKETGVEVLGRDKQDAARMLEEQWQLHYPDISLPPRHRIKLVEIERIRKG